MDGNGEAARRLIASAPVQVLLGATLLLSPAMFVGHPFIFSDSGTYLNFGRHVASEVWAAFTWGAARIVPLSETEADYAGARSPVYAAFLFLVVKAASLWGLSAVQAACGAYAIRVFRKCVAPSASPGFFWILILLATAGTAAPYFVAFAMPDVFLGIAMLILPAALCGWQHTSLADRVAMTTLLAFAAASHTTTAILLLFALGLGVSLVRVVNGERLARGMIATCVIALGMGAASGPAYRGFDNAVMGHDLHAPPFLTARLLADGTGLAWLESACPDRQVHPLCERQFEAPIDSDVFLWGREGPNAVYLEASPAERAKLRQEELRLVAGTIAHDPLAQIRANFVGWFRQLRMYQVVEPLYEPSSQGGYQGFLPHNPSLAAPGQVRLPQLVQAMLGVVQWTAVFGLGAILIWSAGSRRADDRMRKATLVAAVLLAVLLANAALCGILSKPWYRYEARLIWIYPLALLTLMAELGWLSRKLVAGRSGGGRPTGLNRGSAAASPLACGTPAGCAPRS